MLTTDLSQEIALITGATGGIGKATCLALAALGCNIAVHYNSAADEAKELVEKLKSKGVKADAFQADMGDYESVRKLHAAVISSLGHPTILFNNAGSSCGHSMVGSALDVPIDIFERTWRTNCGSAYLLTQLSLPHMEARGWGRVIFCSSVAAFTGGVVGPHYASSKSALHGLTHWLSAYHCKKGVTVNAVAPALIQETKMLPGSAELAKKVPVGRLGYPDEVAETVVWMVKTGYVTNKVVPVDGGMFAH